MAKARLVTMKMLKSKHACVPARDVFKAHFGKRMRTTKHNVNTLFDAFGEVGLYVSPLAWALDYLLSPAQLSYYHSKVSQEDSPFDDKVKYLQKAFNRRRKDGTKRR